MNSDLHFGNTFCRRETRQGVVASDRIFQEASLFSPNSGACRWRRGKFRSTKEKFLKPQRIVVRNANLQSSNSFAPPRKKIPNNKGSATQFSCHGTRGCKSEYRSRKTACCSAAFEIRFQGSVAPQPSRTGRPNELSGIEAPKFGQRKQF